MFQIPAAFTIGEDRHLYSPFLAEAMTLRETQALPGVGGQSLGSQATPPAHRSPWARRPRPQPTGVPSFKPVWNDSAQPRASVESGSGTA